MNYQSENPEVCSILGKPRWYEWLEFEVEHINRQIGSLKYDTNYLELSHFMPHLKHAQYLKDVAAGGHEIERLVHYLAEAINPRYHKYLHLELTSSNVIDSCNHRRWNRLLGLLNDSIDRLVIQHSSNQVIGFTHGRKAHRVSSNHRFLSCLRYHELEHLPGDVSGGPTGDQGRDGYVHRQAFNRSDYFSLWAKLARTAYCMEQLATDYRFYCSDFAQVVGVTGLLAPGVATTSSAMPGKVNPTVFERVCSVGYMVRTMCTAQMLQPPKWLDADLVHSALERETIDRIWHHTFWLVETMTELVKTTKLEVTNPARNHTSFGMLQIFQKQGVEYSEARRMASQAPTG